MIYDDTKTSSSTKSSSVKTLPLTSPLYHSFLSCIFITLISYDIYYVPKSPPDVEAHDVKPEETCLKRIVDDES